MSLITEGEGDYELETACRRCGWIYRKRFKVKPTKAQMVEFVRVGMMHEGKEHEELK